jgi:hypothetical protein
MIVEGSPTKKEANEEEEKATVSQYQPMEELKKNSDSHHLIHWCRGQLECSSTVNVNEYIWRRRIQRKLCVYYPLA